MKKNQIRMVSLAMSFVGIGVLGVGCSGDIKTVVKPASHLLDPLPAGAVVETTSGVDPLVAEQWTVEKLGLNEVWKSGGLGTRRVTVAILSTGVDYNHEDLRGNILVNSVESLIRRPGDTTPVDNVDNDQNGYVDDIVGYDVIDDDGLPFDQLGTGTAAAGIIGAIHENSKGIKGINASVSMIPIRYINENGRTTIPNLVSALKYAAAVRPDIALVHLANIDFAAGVRNAAVRPQIAAAEEAAISEALTALKTLNIPVIASAGNSGSDLGRMKSVVKKFSDFENVLVVTSVDESDKRPFISNYGIEIVDTSAPGEGVLTTLPHNFYGKESGTFMAAAHAAGGLALAYSKHYGRFNYKKYYEVLLSDRGGNPLPGMQFETVSGNRLNLAKFLAALE